MKNSQRSLRDCLLSIKYDCEWVEQFKSQFSPEEQRRLPVVPNRRSGVWYVSNAHDSTTVYFKSTDGHYGQWDFNVRRMNLHLLDLIASRACGEGGGCILVDVTKKGKRFPDSFSKTVPIWCAVLNLILSADRFEEGVCLPLHIAGNESKQIQERLPFLVDKARSVMNDQMILRLRSLIKKPLRPLWFCPGSSMISRDMAEFLSGNQVPFHPIICLSASSVDDGETSLRQVMVDARLLQFHHVQGAADDAESWAGNCSTSVVLDNLSALLECSDDAEISAMLKRLSNETVDQSCSSLSEIGDTGLFISNWQSSIDHYHEFQLVINCTEERPDCLPSGEYLHLCIPEGKKGQHKLLQSFQLVCTEYKRVAETLGTHPKTLVHCRQGKDRSVGVALVLLLTFHSTRSDTSHLDKDDIRKALVHLQQYRPFADPSRATLKQVIGFFTSFLKK